MQSPHDPDSPDRKIADAFVAAQQALKEHKSMGGHRDAMASGFRGEIDFALARAQVAALTQLSDSIRDSERALVKGMTNLQGELTKTNAVLSDARSSFVAASEQSSRSSEALVRWTRWMVIAIVAQVVVLLLQLVIAWKPWS